MTIQIKADFAFHLFQPTDLLLQFEAANIPEQEVLSTSTKMTPSMHTARVPAQDAVGERIWVRAEGAYSVSYEAQVKVNRLIPDIGNLPRLDPHELPGEAVEYLFDSRYCQADRLQVFVSNEFDGLEGGARVLAMRDWIRDNFSYVPGSSNSTTTALDSFVERQGVCRDYAHVLISFARASTIPARFVSCFAPGVNPPDFHAVAEVFLADPTIPGGGAWHIIDATDMADPANTVKIGIGRDAADVSFLTSFGNLRFDSKIVDVTKLED